MRRVVVTGMGMVTPLGCGVETAWQRLIKGESGAKIIDTFDISDVNAKVACMIPRGDGGNGTFNPDQWMEPKEQRKVDDFILYAMCAAKQSLDDAGWRPESYEDQTSTGVLIGSGIGGFDVIEREHTALLEGGPRKISPFFIPASIINLAAGHVSMRVGAKGPNEATATACTTSAHSIGDSFRIIQRGDADVMIAGGAEAAITPMGVGGFAAMRALSTRNDDPTRASRPWDKDRDGFVMGEGAGILVLEELEHAQRRGATILAEIVGYGMSADAYHMTQPAPEHEGGFRVMRNALRDANLDASVVGYLNAHGTSTPIGDTLEAHAIRNLFGKKVPVSSTKSMTGHLLGGAGGLEAGVTVLALRDQIVPPTINLDQPGEGCDLDYVPKVARQAKLEHTLSNSFGFGGTNGSLIFRRL